MASCNYLIVILFTLCTTNLCTVSGSEENFRLVTKRTRKGVDGGWGSWGDWSEYGDCPVNCGTGFVKSSRQRECDNPAPSDGGNYCVGDILETNVTACSSDNCPGNGNDITGSIFRWSQCIPLRGSGIKIRAKGACNPNLQQNCLNRKVFWEIHDCTETRIRRIKRSGWLFGYSYSRSSNGDDKYTVRIGPISFSLIFDRSGLSGGGFGISEHIKGAYGVNVGYSRNGGLSVGATAFDIGGPLVGYSGGASYSSKNGKTLRLSSRYPQGSSNVKVNDKTGISVETGFTIRRKRKVKHSLIEDEICERSGETIFGHPENCRMFIICHEGVAYEDSCSEDEVWNDAAKRCDPEDTCEI